LHGIPVLHDTAFALMIGLYAVAVVVIVAIGMVYDDHQEKKREED